MRKGRDGEKKTGEKKENTGENSGHYVIASSDRPNADRAGTPHARANTLKISASVPAFGVRAVNCWQ